MKKIVITDTITKTVKKFTVKAKARGGFIMVYRTYADEISTLLIDEGSMTALALLTRLSLRMDVSKNTYVTSATQLAEDMKATRKTIVKALARLQSIHVVRVEELKSYMLRITVSPYYAFHGSAEEGEVALKNWDIYLKSEYIE